MVFEITKGGKMIAQLHARVPDELYAFARGMKAELHTHAERVIPAGEEPFRPYDLGQACFRVTKRSGKHNYHFVEPAVWTEREMQQSWVNSHAHMQDPPPFDLKDYVKSYGMIEIETIPGCQERVFMRMYQRGDTGQWEWHYAESNVWVAEHKQRVEDAG